ncbi:MAG TPA: PPC domain-containing protein [Verrucomicrobiales bacterium]|nr:PPC domain-containing protein [Verrucomicrobiales bacterium]
MRVLIPLSGLIAAAPAAEPVLTHIYPAGVQSGTEVDVKLIGKFDPWPCKVWADEPGIVFTSGKKAGEFHAAVAAGVRPGPHLIRAFNGEGASAPISLTVSGRHETLETEPNDDFRKPQVLADSTATCNGRLDKSDDVDSYAVTLKKGQVMVAWVEAYVLAAGFDAMLRVLDERGTTLAFNHDYTSTDPLIVFTAPQDGRYVVQTTGHNYPASTDIRFASGDDCIYRLHVSTEPLVRNTWPLAVTRGKNSKVKLEGWNLTVKEVVIDDSVPHSFPVTFSAVPEVIEAAGPQKLEIPCAISGRLGQTREEDRFTFAAAKGTPLELIAAGPAYGSLIDPWIKVLGSDGKMLEFNDDKGGTDESRINWTVPADGTYTAVVGDLCQRGGPDLYYRLLIQKPAAAAAGTIVAHAFKLAAGKTEDLKVSVSLMNGYNSKLKLAALNLPPGVSADEKEVPKDGGSVTLKLAASPAAAPASLPFQLVLREVEGGREVPVRYSIASTSEDNGVPNGYRQLLINSTEQLWLTVTVPPAPAK